MESKIGLKAIEDIMELINKHEAYRTKECLNLRADENYTSPQVRKVLASDFCHRSTSPDAALTYRGTKYINDVYDLTISIGNALFNSKYLNIFPPTGHTANIMIYFAFCKPEDKVLVLDPEHGGYGGMARTNLPRLLGLTTLYFPFDLEKMQIDVGATIELIKKERPSLIIFGATIFLFPQSIKEVAEVARSYDIPIAYDGSHVLGLIAGGTFQDPLRQGADILFGSTMKTLAGPPGGIIVTNNSTINKKLLDVTWYHGITSPHWNRIAALGIVFAEGLRKGNKYASQVVKNTKALAAACHYRGLRVMYKELGFTASHTFLLDVGGLKENVIGKASGMAALLEKANIIIDDRGRVGTGEVTRLGMKEYEMEIIAEMMTAAIDGNIATREIIKKVYNLRSKFSI